MYDFKAKFVEDAVCSVFNCSEESMEGRARSEQMSYARCIWTKLLYDLKDENGNRLLTQTQVGKIVNRTHSTVIYRVKCFDSWYEVYPDFRDLANMVKARVGSMTMPAHETIWIMMLTKLSEESQKDSGEAHAEADYLISDILRQLGYGRVADAYDKIEKTEYYA